MGKLKTHETNDLLELGIFLGTLALITILLISFSAGFALLGSGAVLLLFVGWTLTRNLMREDEIRESDTSIYEIDSRQKMPDRNTERHALFNRAIRYGWLPLALLLTIVPLFALIYYLFE